MVLAFPDRPAVLEREWPLFQTGLSGRRRQVESPENGDGGAIYNSASGVIATIEDSIFESNGYKEGVDVSDKRGGAIYNTGVITSYDETSTQKSGIYNVQFGSLNSNEGNSAQYGGAIYNISNTDLNIEKSSFYNNKARNDGGAIFNANGTLTIKAETNFEGNSAEEDGGAIFNNANLVISPKVAIGGNDEQNNSEEYEAYEQGDILYNELSIMDEKVKSGKIDLNMVFPLFIANL